MALVPGGSVELVGGMPERNRGRAGEKGALALRERGERAKRLTGRLRALNEKVDAGAAGQVWMRGPLQTTCHILGRDCLAGLLC